jgi:5'-3' exonuclease, N-terminal resolvase-like domain
VVGVQAIGCLQLRRHSTSGGQPINAVFNFATMLFRILKEHEPTHIAIAFDVGGKNFRHEMYPDYRVVDLLGTSSTDQTHRTRVVWPRRRRRPRRA